MKGEIRYFLKTTERDIYQKKSREKNSQNSAIIITRMMIFVCRKIVIIIMPHFKSNNIEFLLILCMFFP